MKAITRLACGPLSCVAAWAQTDQGRITGIVTDPSGGAVPGAAIEVAFRWMWQPSENVNFGRVFGFGERERYNFEIRAEFTNIFNRHFYATPGTAHHG